MLSYEEKSRHYVAGSYTCPATQAEVELEVEVPRPWIEWPIRVKCQACGMEHLLQYEAVRQKEPAFGHE